MIIAKTKLKKIPEKCFKCKFCTHTSDYKKAQGKVRYIIYPGRTCLITGQEVPYVYNEAKRNWEYTKCKTCPLIEKEN